MLVRLLYASRSEGVTQETIEAILAQSRRHNPANGITGILCHSGDVFMQVLEGGRSAVNALYREICKDPRHDAVTLLHYALDGQECDLPAREMEGAAIAVGTDVVIDRVEQGVAYVELWARVEQRL